MLGGMGLQRRVNFYGAMEGGFFHGLWEGGFRLHPGKSESNPQILSSEAGIS